MTGADAHAKLNLGLVVGERLPSGKHEVVTVLQRLELADHIELAASDALVVDGFAQDTIVRRALESLGDTVGVDPAWHVRIEKRIPVAAGLGGGSSDAATALRLANATLADPLTVDSLARVAATVGADVPFFLHEGAQLATVDGTELRSISIPGGYTVLLVVPDDAHKASTGAVYDAFDERGGPDGFETRRTALLRALEALETADDLADLPANDLARSPLTARLRSLGALRADVTGAGPTVYGLFTDADVAGRAAAGVADLGSAILTRPV